MKAQLVYKGGKGSGNFRHAGRPGKQGGSAPNGNAGSGANFDPMRGKFTSLPEGWEKMPKNNPDLGPGIKGVSKIFDRNGSQDIVSVYYWKTDDYEYSFQIDSSESGVLSDDISDPTGMFDYIEDYGKTGKW